MAAPKQRLKQPGFDCIYNTSRFNDREVADLLTDDGKKLFVKKEQIGDSQDAASYEIHVGGNRYFAKDIKNQNLYYKLRGKFISPWCWKGYWAAELLGKASLPTPAPVIAAVLKSAAPWRQVLITDFCDDATSLPAYVNKCGAHDRTALVPELANLLAEFHSKGFHCRDLRAADILVRNGSVPREFWFTDVGPVSFGRFMPRRRGYVRTVAAATAQLFDSLTPEQRNFFIISCFDAALKRNVFTKPSQQQPFVERVVKLSQQLVEQGA